ncbi:MAG: pyridine nucleotide-disulfide oxidoreductase [Thermotoga sp.]|nr:MAG: pyridine nucleotide-disulfide oxidoreductase [Thermotoga sp.]
MKKEKVDVLVVGGGAGGIAGAISASRYGVKTLLIEREDRVGGVLNQCIHNGFGVLVYGEELTGPEFLFKLLEESKGDFEVRSGETVLRILKDEKVVITVSKRGITCYEVGALVVATGARERPFSTLMIPGPRVSGIYTAGVVQKMVNIYNRLPGKKAMVLGSGDIGLIMARRLKLEGVDVLGVIEIKDEVGGSLRNFVQCLRDFEIPLLTKHTISKVHGNGRIKGVTVVEVDENFKPIDGSGKFFEIDTLVVSVGLIPQNQILEGLVEFDPINGGPVVDDLQRTNIEWIFSAGNSIAIHDLVDFVYEEGVVAGRNAARLALGERLPRRKLKLVRGKNIGVMVPNYLTGDENRVKMYMRVRKTMEGGELRVQGGRVRKYNFKVRPGQMLDVVLDVGRLSFPTGERIESCEVEFHEDRASR